MEKYKKGAYLSEVRGAFIKQSKLLFALSIGSKLLLAFSFG